MQIQLSPESSEIRVKDRIQIPEQVHNVGEPVKLAFYLHAALTVTGVQDATIEVDDDEIALKSR
ncbi:MAG TPA: hypothetical protein PK754_16835, partial [bacterium]|nr:hypothetical protein [bacterium]